MLSDVLASPFKSAMWAKRLPSSPETFVFSLVGQADGVIDGTHLLVHAPVGVGAAIHDVLLVFLRLYVEVPELGAVRWVRQHTFKGLKLLFVSLGNCLFAVLCILIQVLVAKLLCVLLLVLMLDLFLR